MGLSFFLAAVLVLVVPFALMIAIQRHLGLETSWYGLLMMGFGAAVAAYLVMMGVGLIYSALFLPSQMAQEALVRRVDVLLINYFLLGILMEAGKSYGVSLFDTSVTRGNWTLYGVAIGTGAGLCQALWLLGATGLTLLGGGEEAGARELWLALRCGTLVLMEAALGAQIMYQTARDKRLPGVALVGSVHGLTLLLPALLALTPAGESVQSWVGSALALAVSLGAGLSLWWQVKTRGWPT